MDFLNLVPEFLKSILGKPNFITLFVAPILVGIATLVVEYAVIQPLKKSILRGILSVFFKIVLLFTVVFLMITTLLVIGSNLPTFFTLHEFLPEISFDLTGLLSDANISFAAIIYSLIIIYPIFHKWDIYTILRAFLPPLLFFFWSLAFIRDDLLLLLLVLVASNLWLLGVLFLEENVIALYMAVLLFPLNMLLLIALEITMPTLIALCLVIYWFIQQSVLGILVGFHILVPSSHRLALFAWLCWPLNSLILINYNVLTSVWSWVAAAVFGAIQYVVLLALKY